MKPLLLILLATLLTPLHAQTPLDPAATERALSFRVRNPVKSTAPVIKRTYTRKPVKGLGVEVDVEIAEHSDGTTTERPFVAVPILFIRSTDQLLDDLSQQNVFALAQVLRTVLAKDPRARFSIQGHTSAEGNAEPNQQLSDARARKIHTLLTQAHGIPAGCLNQVGFGEQWAAATEDAPEPLRQKDRRVLVVRQ